MQESLHWRWCRGGKGLQRVREFHSHHPSFPQGKAWICARVCGKKEKKRVKFSLLRIRNSHILTHIPSFQQPDLFLPPGFSCSYTSPFCREIVGCSRRRMCLFIENRCAWKVSNRKQPSQRRRQGGALSPLGEVTRGELKHWNLVVRMNRERNKQRCFRLFFFCFCFFAWALSECI